jgi:hypothetical protein
MNPGTMKLPAAVQQTVDATAPVENNHQTPTALGSQLEDPPRETTARAVPTEAAAVLVEATAVAVEAVVASHHMVLAEELVAAANVEAEATQTATPPATHVAATMPGTKSMKLVAKRLLKQTTVTASPPNLLNFATCSSLINSSLLGSPSTTRSKTQFGGLGAMPYPLRMLVATMIRSASTSPSARTMPHSPGSSRSTIIQSMSGNS